MEVTISVYCTKQQWNEFLREHVLDAVGQALEKVEAYVAENRYGLPWMTETWEDGTESIFLTNSFEIGYVEDYRDNLDDRPDSTKAVVSGWSWSPYEYWDSVESPEEV